LGLDLNQLDFKNVQGAGETRIAADSRVPAVILGISESLGGSSLNLGNFGMARRLFADGFLRPQWRSASACLEKLVAAPAGSELWYDESDVSFLREDEADQANIIAANAASMRQLVDGGYDPDSVTDAVTRGDLTQLKHTGMFSVQLQPPGTKSDPAVPGAAEQEMADGQEMNNGNGHKPVPA
jgi:hypothetical protein